VRVEVLLFAAAREAAGGGAAALELPDGATVADAFAALAERHPALRGVLPACRAALDEEFVPTSARLRPGSVVAVLPPVSGG
jgi:molybdopterin converting factor subunit 1